MDLMHMIGETSLMMGFTFIVGMAFAYVLKLMTFFFSRLNGTEISALLRKVSYLSQTGKPDAISFMQ